MKCPQCALYHPAQYTECVACGAGLEQEPATAEPKRGIFGFRGDKKQAQTTERRPAAARTAPPNTLTATAPSVPSARQTVENKSAESKRFDRQSQIDATKRSVEALTSVGQWQGDDSNQAQPAAADKRQVHALEQHGREALIELTQKQKQALLIEAENASVQNELRATKQELEQLQALRNGTQQQLDAKRRETEELESQRREALERLEKQKAEMEHLEAQRAEAQRRLLQAKVETERLQAERSTSQQMLDKQKQALERLLADKVEAGDLKLQVEQLEEQRLGAQRQIEAKELESKTLAARELEMQKQLDQRQHNAVQLEQQQARMQGLLDSRKVEAQQLQAQKQETEEQLDAKIAEAEWLKKRNEKAQDQLRSLRAETEQLEAKTETVKKQLETARLQAGQIEAEMIEAQKSVDAQKLEATRKIELKKQEVQGQLEAARQQAGQIEAEMLEAQKLVDAQKSEAQKNIELKKVEVQRQLEAAKHQADQLEAEMVEAQKLVDAQRVGAQKQIELKKQEVQKQLESAKRQAEKLDAEKVEIQKRFDAQMTEAQKQIEQQKLEVQKQLQIAKRQTEELEAEKTAIQQRLDLQKVEAQKQIELQKREASNQLEAAKREAENLEAQKDQLRKQLEDQKKEAEGLLKQKAESQKAFEAQRKEAELLEAQRQLHAQHLARLQNEQAHQLDRQRADVLLVGAKQTGSEQSAGRFHEKAANDSHDSHQRRRPREPFDSREHGRDQRDSEGSSDKQQPRDSTEAFYSRRNSGGGGRDSYGQFKEESSDDVSADDSEQDASTSRQIAHRSRKTPRKRGFPIVFAAIVFISVLLIFAGATIFFITKAPDDQRLYLQGQEELKKGQYAFAVTTLTKAAALKPKDPRVVLSLARAYIGVDQIDKAWECVSQAQSLGAGVAEEPALASDLAKYYRQRGQYDKAINLLRPLAKAEVDGKRPDLKGKKAELADLDAMWGDDALRDGNLELALRCWEEVRDLNDGSRVSEAQPRLATIYQKLANSLASDDDKKNDVDALKYLNKLNNIAQNPKNLEMAADLYEKSGQLELAIDQLRKAEKLGDKGQGVERKLASLLSRRGKELLDQGNADAGYAYLQQAKSVSPGSSLPAVALKDIAIVVDPSSRMPKISGRIWNPTDKSVNSLNMRVELFDTKTSRVLWSKEQKLVDEFVPPLGAQESKSFDFSSDSAAVPKSEFRVYLDGNLYKSYPLKLHQSDDSEQTANSSADDTRTILIPPRTPSERTAPPPLAPMRAKMATPIESPAPAPAPEAAPAPTQAQTPTPAERPARGSGSEEQTMKDLEQ